MLNVICINIEANNKFKTFVITGEYKVYKVMHK